MSQSANPYDDNPTMQAFHWELLTEFDNLMPQRTSEVEARVTARTQKPCINDIEKLHDSGLIRVCNHQGIDYSQTVPGTHAIITPEGSRHLALWKQSPKYKAWEAEHGRAMAGAGKK